MVCKVVDIVWFGNANIDNKSSSIVEVVHFSFRFARDVNFRSTISYRPVEVA